MDGPTARSLAHRKAFEALVRPEAVFGHLEQLLIVANSTPANSRSVLNAYPASAAYIRSRLNESEAAGYFTVHEQPFVAPVWEELGTPALSVGAAPAVTLEAGRDFDMLRYSGNTSGAPLAGTVAVVPPGSECDASGYTATRDKVAVVTDANMTLACDTYRRALFAQEAGAIAFIIRRNAPGLAPSRSRARANEWNDTSAMITIPALSASYTAGQLLATADVAVSMQVFCRTVLANTFNVFAMTRDSLENSTVVAGAHLDSVDEGPGINDDGSGSAVVLEMALQFYRNNVKPRNSVVFAWFGAEEEGLIGSRYFVRDLVAKDPDHPIVANVNYDMLGSPNYARIVYNGQSAPEDSRNGSVIVSGWAMSAPSKAHRALVDAPPRSHRTRSRRCVAVASVCRCRKCSQTTSICAT